MNNKKLLLSILFSPLIFSNQCEDIELFFNAPMDGFKTNAKEFKVEFGSKNIQITPAGIEVEDRQSCIVGGHHHLIINNAYDVDKNMMEPIPYGANILHFGGGQTEAVLSLNPGKYTLQLVAGDHEHRPIKPFGASKEYKPVSSKKITIEILPN